MLAAATCDMLAYVVLPSKCGGQNSTGAHQEGFKARAKQLLIPGIRSSPYIRSQYDILECDSPSSEDPPPADVTATAPPGMFFEWMDHHLWQVPSERFR